MSHVEDGALHAYLDGALEALPAAEATRVREHLATCAACQARLEEERSLRAEASAILAGAAPDVGDVPPLEELRAIAAARGRGAAGAGPRLRQLSWAASIVVALGAGWMLRGATAPTLVSDALQRSAGEVAEQPVLEERFEAEASGEREVLPTAVADEDPSSGAQETATTGRGEPGAGALEGARSDVAPASPARDRLAQTAVGRESAPPETQEPPPLVRTDSAGLRVAEEMRPTLADAVLRQEGKAADSAAAAGNVTELAEGVALRRRSEADEEARRALELDRLTVRAVDAAAPAVQAAGAERPAEEPADAALGREAEVASGLGGSLVVPGLEVVAISWLQGEDLAGAVRVLQRLETGDLLELVHLPPGIEPSALPPLEPGERAQVVVPRQAGWLVARSAASPDVLRSLISRLTGGSD